MLESFSDKDQNKLSGKPHMADKRSAYMTNIYSIRHDKINERIFLMSIKGTSVVRNVYDSRNIAIVKINLFQGHHILPVLIK